MPPFPADPSRFDLVLLFMAVAVAGGVGVGAVSSVSMQVGVSAGSLLASVGVVDGLVWNPPTAE